MAKFVDTKIMSIFVVVELALASTPTEMLKTSEEGDGLIIPPTPFPPTTNYNIPIGPIVHIWFHNAMGNGQKVTVHPHTPKQDWGSRDLVDGQSGYMEIVGIRGYDIRGDFKWGHQQIGCNIFVLDRDSNRCSINPANWDCTWNITTMGLLGINDQHSHGQVDILLKWDA